MKQTERRAKKSRLSEQGRQEYRASWLTGRGKLSPCIPSPMCLHPWAPSPCVLGVTVGVLIRKDHRHRVFVVELKAGKELLDDIGVFF